VVSAVVFGVFVFQKAKLLSGNIERFGFEHANDKVIISRQIYPLKTTFVVGVVVCACHSSYAGG
jgi:hypothetical protein